MNNIIRINICLVPPTDVAEKAIALGTSLAPYEPLFFLGSKHTIPHVSLYMSDAPTRALSRIAGVVADIADVLPVIELSAKEYRYSPRGYLDIAYHDDPWLRNTQKHIIEAVNPLRENVLAFADVLHEFEAPRRENASRYGYPEIGSFFVPHLTFTRVLRTNGSPIELPIPKECFSFIPASLAISRTGEHGVSEEILYSFPLDAKKRGAYTSNPSRV